MFSKDNFNKLPPRHPWDHAINLKPDAKSIRAKIFPLSPLEHSKMKDWLAEHKTTGHIHDSISSFTLPFFFVKKKDGDLRPIQDYHHLNGMSVKNRYLLPLISNLMDKLKGSKVFTKLDMWWSFNNVHICEGNKHKAAFILEFGLFEPLVMFFGLTNSPVTFQNMMNDLFRELIAEGHVIIYMDDILMFMDDLESHHLLV